MRLPAIRRLRFESLESRLNLAAGSLDESFGELGVRTFNFSHPSNDQLLASHAQADGKMVIVANAKNQLMIARFSANGLFDKSFDFDGKMVIPDVDAHFAGVTVQRNGQILVVNSQFLIRVNRNGSIDTHFGTAGRVALENVYATKVFALNDDKILIGGNTFLNSPDIAVRRFLSDGSIDSTFSGDGLATFDSGLTDQYGDFALQSNGKIVFVGSKSIGFDQTQLLVGRFNANGSLDRQFDTTDTTAVLLPTAYSTAGTSVAIQANGQIVVGVRASMLNAEQSALLRLLSTGKIDNHFGDNGAVIAAPFEDASYPRDIEIQADGSILLGMNGDTRFAITRYVPHGKLDLSFGTQGTIYSASTPNLTGSTILTSIHLLPHNKIAGTSTSPGSSPFFDIRLNRYSTTGIADSAFGVAGQSLIDLRGDFDNTGLTDSILQSDGKILLLSIAMGTQTIPTSSPAVVRFNPRGDVDRTFGNDGSTIISHSYGIYPQSLLSLSSGKIVVAGLTDNSPGGRFIAFARLNPNGLLDTTFGTAGVLITNVRNPAGSLHKMILQPDGKILMVADNVTTSTNLPSESGFLLLRFNSDGTLDKTFDFDGKKSFHNTLGQLEKLLIRIQPDGKLLGIAAHKNAQNRLDFSLVRLLTDGSLDPEFHTSGYVDLPAISNLIELNDFQVQPDGKCLLAVQRGLDLAVLRYLPTGTIETTFAAQGIFQTRLANGYHKPVSLALQTNGKILISVEVPENTDSNFGLLRLNANGTLDKSFHGDGIFTLSLGDDDVPASLLVATNGRMIVTGTSDRNLVLMRHVPTNGLPKLISNQLLTIQEGATGALHSQLLQSIDNDDPDANLIYEITTTPQHGSLSLTNFTQSQINQGVVTYQHNGSETSTDSFEFKFRDGAGAVLGSFTFSIQITPVNDLPQVVLHTMPVVEDATQLFDTRFLQINDADSIDSNLLITIPTPPAYGQFEFIHAPEVAIQAFNYEQVATGKVVYRAATIGVAGVNIPLQISDEIASIPQLYSLIVEQTNVNDAPQIICSPSLTVQIPEYNFTRFPVFDEEFQVVTITISGGIDGNLFHMNGGIPQFLNAPVFSQPQDANQDNVYEVLLRATDAEGAFTDQLFSITVDQPAFIPTLVIASSLNMIELRDRAGKADHWQFTFYDDRVTIEDKSSNPDNVLLVSGIPNVTGSGTKTISIPWKIVAPTLSPWRIYAGDENDLIEIDSRMSVRLTSAQLSFDLGQGEDTLDFINSQFYRAWNFTGSQSGTINGTLPQFSFDGVEHAQGGRGTDAFYFSPTAFPSNIQSIDGEDGHTNDSLFVDSDSNITLTDSRLIWATLPPVNKISTFLLGHISSITVQGGEGNNRFDATATQVPVKFIGKGGDDTLVGGSGNDELIGNSGHDLILGRGGNDILSGGDQRDILIGGTGSDQINALSSAEPQNGEDILIGGFTQWDYDFTTLGTIVDVWKSNLVFNERVVFLRDMGVSIQSNKLSASTVQDDNTFDELTGGLGHDWFFARLENGFWPEILDATAVEQNVIVEL